MNTPRSICLVSIFAPARCSSRTETVTGFFKCMAAQGMSGISAAAKARQNDRNATGVANLSHHVQHDIGMTQGQRMAAQLAPVLTSASQQRLPKESEARQAGVYM